MGITIKDLAKLAGVSRGTIDKALNNRPGISEVTRERILRMAEELEYQPQFRQKCRAPVAIRIKVENDGSLEEFNANTSLNFDEKAYSNAFSWIAIYNRDKKRKLFEFETA